MNQNEKIEYVKNYLQKRIDAEFLYPFQVSFKNGNFHFSLKQNTLMCSATHKADDHLMDTIIDGSPFDRDDIVHSLFRALTGSVSGNNRILQLQHGSYEEVKDYLILRPLNLNQFLADLTDIPHIRLHDIALVLYVVIAHNCDDYYTAKINRDQLARWGKTKADILREALANTSRLYPPRLYSVRAILEGDCSPNIDFMLDDVMNMFSENYSSYILTNSMELNGAAAMFYPGVLTRLAKFLGQSFYIAFTSIHEAQIHVKDCISEDVILNALRDTNRHCNTKEETLSDNVYFYSKSRRTFGVLENGEFKELWQIAGEDK